MNSFAKMLAVVLAVVCFGSSVQAFPGGFGTADLGLTGGDVDIRVSLVSIIVNPAGGDESTFAATGTPGHAGYPAS